MLKKLAVLFVILGSSVFAQWEKEYVKDEFGQPTKRFYLVHQKHDDSFGMLFSKSNLIVQLNERAKENLYTSTLVNELISITDEKGEIHKVEATVLVDLDNNVPYSIVVNTKNKAIIDLMKNNEKLVFTIGSTGNTEDFAVSFHDFNEVYDSASATNFIDK